MRELSDTLAVTFRRMFRLENRRAAIRRGRLERLSGFDSAILGNRREVTVYLPAGYDEHPDRRYPVLYLQDGQNLFDAERAFIPGQHWRLSDAADAAIGERTMAPVILVGIDNAGPARIDEYTPVRDAKHASGGRAGDYGRMLAEELKPAIDARFRTLPEPSETAIGGSSLGGLLALDLVLRRPDLFTRALVMSPSVWWAGRAVLATVDQYGGTRPRMWVDVGGREGAEALTDARELRARLVRRGWTEENFRFYEDRRGDHSERAWSRRVRTGLEFLFPPG